MLRRGRGMAAVCVIWRRIGAASRDAPRSGACRAATKRMYPPTGVGGAWPLRGCACGVPCLH